MNRRACYILFAIVWISTCAYAQYTSNLGRFQVDQVKGCAPLTINITINPPSTCSGSAACDMTFGDGQAAQNSFTHTYTQPGTYTLQILFQTTGFDNIQIVVTPNVQPQFDLYSCNNNQVQVNVTDTNYNQYVINYNDASPPVTVPSGSLAKDTHTYSSPGPKSVTVRGRNLGASDNCNSDTKAITALASLPTPTITQLLVTNSSSIQLDFTGQSNILYRLEIATNNATTFQLVKTSYNVVSETVGNLRPDDNYYCFRLGVVDPCNNNAVVYSSTICSSNFDLSIQNNANTLTWVTSSTGISSFRLTRDTQGSSLTTTVSGSSYSDTDVICGTNYCYQLVTNYPNGSRSVSLQKCGVAISTDAPTAIQDITVSITASGADIQWPPPTGFTPTEYTLFKSFKSQYQLLGSTTSAQFSDPEYSTEDESCYQIQYKDVCNNQSARSIEACPVRLSATLLSDNSIALSWSSYSGWQNNVAEYVVEQYTEQGQLLQSYSVGLSTDFVDNSQDLSRQSYVYVIKAVPVDATLSQAASNPVVIMKNPNLFYPTAFTPNGDNLNDVFTVFGHYIDGFELNIFNRWGELMFTTTALDQGWDGNFKGKPMPEGTYAFVADITDLVGRTFKRSGSIVLLRK